MAREGYVTTGDAAKLLGMTRQGVHHRVNAGRYRAEKVLDGKQEHLEIPIEDIRADLPGEITEIERKLEKMTESERSGYEQYATNEIARRELEEVAAESGVPLRRHSDIDTVIELAKSRQEGMKEIAKHLKNTWQINGDAFRLLERQLENKDKALWAMEDRCRRLESQVEENKQRIRELEQHRPWWRRMFE